MKSLTSDSSLCFPALPHIQVDQISGFLEVLVEDGGRESLATLASRPLLSMDDLLPILEAIKLLGFGQVNEADVAVTDAGKAYVNATIFQRRLLFRERVLENVPFIAFMARTLRQSSNLEQEADCFLENLEERFPGVEPEQQFAIAVEWGRYAELFEYNAKTKRLRLLPVKA